MKTLLALALAHALLFAQSPADSWLDRPLTNWNAAGEPVPQPRTGAETISEILTRCPDTPDVSATAAERQVGAAGWLPFHMFDRQILSGDLEIVGGLAAADGMCRPMSFNVFVFVQNRFAGTLSPAAMDSRTDGSVGGAIRVGGDGSIAAEFARYAASDALCCPSARVTVRYRIDRTGQAPLVVPVAVRPTRK